ncbi:MAG: hypothetical protein AAGF20_00165 [Pseudomonadota bacterium]
MSESATPDFDKAYDFACDLTGMNYPIAVLRSTNKGARISMFRAAMMAYLRVLNPRKFSYPVIARLFGRRCHSGPLFLATKAFNDGWGQGWTHEMFAMHARPHRSSRKQGVEPLRYVETIITSEMFRDMIAIGETNLQLALILTAPQPEERAA